MRHSRDKQELSSKNVTPPRSLPVTANNLWTHAAIVRCTPCIYWQPRTLNIKKIRRIHRFISRRRNLGRRPMPSPVTLLPTLSELATLSIGVFCPAEAVKNCVAQELPEDRFPHRR
mmetsp:Transcript_72719/g.157822  ORF Transcript_72719/g.157822 Transcript_72719/m.157822 type:complete len:116 (+) Transcript_72719:255-602(+)